MGGVIDEMAGFMICLAMLMGVGYVGFMCGEEGGGRNGFKRGCLASMTHEPVKVGDEWKCVTLERARIIRGEK